MYDVCGAAQCMNERVRIFIHICMCVNGARIYVKSNTSQFKLNPINKTHNETEKEEEEELDEVEENGAAEERVHMNTYHR